MGVTYAVEPNCKRGRKTQHRRVDQIRRLAKLPRLRIGFCIKNHRRRRLARAPHAEAPLAHHHSLQRRRVHER